MKPYLLRHLGLGIAIAITAAAPAQAATTSIDTSLCSPPTLSQPFVSWGDMNSYALVAGQSVDDFNAAGWMLRDGAKIVTTALADGTTGSVVDLPSGSSAVSPTICITSDYSSARMMVSNQSGSNRGLVAFSVSYAGTSSETNPRLTGTVKTTGVRGADGGWELSDPLALEPRRAPGWQPMQITLTARGQKTTDFQLYNLYVDPNARG